MAKSQRRSEREPKKLKQNKAKVTASRSPLAAVSGRPAVAPANRK